MSGNFRNNLQAAILFDGHADILPSMGLNQFRMAMLSKGIPWRILHENRDSVVLAGPDDLQLTCSYLDKPADHAVFSQVLASPFTRIMFPNAQDVVQRHGSHMLIEVQQGVFGGVEDEPRFAALFQEINFPRAGRDLGSFNRRVDILAQACLSLGRETPASAVHWTQSNTLVPGEKLDPFLEQTGPGLLTIHPFMFGGAAIPGYREVPVEIYTIGAAEYVGREIHTDFAPIPWVDVYQSITAFVGLATMPNGYIIPDGHTFGIETQEFSWRVTHLDGTNQETVNGKPYFNLKLLYHRKHGYTAPDFTGRELLKGGIREAADQFSGPDDARREAIDEWTRSEDMARKAGGQFEIYRTNDPAEPPPDPRPKRLFGSQVDRIKGVFGKRKT